MKDSHPGRKSSPTPTNKKRTFLRSFRWPGPPSKGVLVSRPNRFLAVVDGGGERFEAHVPDPGRLEDLLVPGANVWTLPTTGGKRKTAHTVVLAESRSRPGVVACTDSLMANDAAAVILERGLVQGLPTGPWRREVRIGRSRFDFAMARHDGRDMVLEVKSVTLVDQDGRALFPDAPTKRGARHLEELANLAGQGIETAVLFCVSRKDGMWVEPFAERDPDFAQAFLHARRAGVSFFAARLDYDEDGAWFLEPIPVRPV